MSKLTSLIQRLRPQAKRQIIVMFSLVAVGVGLLVTSNASGTTLDVEPENGVISGNATIFSGSGISKLGAIRFGGNTGCNSVVPNLDYSYQVPFGNSPWNIPACNIPLLNNSAAVATDYGRRVFDFGTAWESTVNIESQKGKFQIDLGLGADINDYSTPIYYATNATTGTKKIKICDAQQCYPSNLDSDTCKSQYENVACMAPDLAIPWDDSWRPSGAKDDYFFDDASDREMVIVDTRNNRVYSLWGVDRSGFACTVRNIWYELNGRNPSERLCVGSATILRNSTGAVASYYTYNQGVLAERGVGLQNSAMIVTPEEVAAGEIRHAMAMEIFNAGFGPACTPSQLQTRDYNVIGKTCGYAAAPAGVFDWSESTDITRKVYPSDTVGVCENISKLPTGGPNGETFKELMTIDKLVPEGMRFKLNITDQQITDWLNSKGYTGTKRNTAKIFAVALRDYGWIISDGTCSTGVITTAGGANTAAKAQWAALGLTSAADNGLLHGLFTRDNIVALEPPTSQCVNGSQTKFYCSWLSSTY